MFLFAPFFFWANVIHCSGLCALDVEFYQLNYAVMHIHVYMLGSKSSVLLGLSLTGPLMVACLSVARPIWIRNGYQFWFPRLKCADPEGNPRSLGTKEVRTSYSHHHVL